MAEPDSQSANKNKVVIGVDDLPQHLRLLEQCIVSGGYTFIGASGGLACLQLVARVRPRLILLDVQMPDVDGYETCRRLRIDPGLNQVPVAFLTSRNSPEDVKLGLAAGGNDFILKPVAITRLMERVKYWTSRRVPPRDLLRSA